MNEKNNQKTNARKIYNHALLRIYFLLFAALMLSITSDYNALTKRLIMSPKSQLNCLYAKSRRLFILQTPLSKTDVRQFKISLKKVKWK